MKAFWDLLSNDRCGLSAVADASIERYREEGRVPVRGLLDRVYDFDPEFFGFSEQDARYLDPQVRQMLLHVHRALHDARIVAPTPAGRGDVALFASLSRSTYRQYLQAADLAVPFVEDYCSEDLAPLRIAHKLNLTGMSMRVQSTCSSSLLALHLACQALRQGECDVAVVTAASITFPQEMGYKWIEGGIHSATGRCRPFDAMADGTVGGDGCAAIVLKRLDDALRDADRVYASVIGSAANNDGGDRIGFSAPSVGGHIDVVRKALQAARLPASRVGLVEAHGTGTFLGDPIEFAALSEAYGVQTPPESICLSAVKGNIGHTDVVAGLAGVIKAVLALSHRVYLPIHGHTRPNSTIDVDRSPFFFSTGAQPWPSNGQPRVAGVSSLGMGGANVHCLLQEAPPAPQSDSFWDWPLAVTIGAASPELLDELSDTLYRQLSQQALPALSQVAHAAARLYGGQPVRFAVVARNCEEFLQRLASRDTRHVRHHAMPSPDAGMAYVFPGVDELPASVVLELARASPGFRQSLHRIHEWFAAEQNVCLFPELFPCPTQDSPFGRLLQEHARIYAVQIALFELCCAVGITPTALVGYSLGEYAAAVCAGVLTEASANQLLMLRSRALADSRRSGWMLSVLCNEAELPPAVKHRMAGSISRELCILAGHTDDCSTVCEHLERHELIYRRIGGDHGLHGGGVLQPPAGGVHSATRLTRGSARWPLFSSYLGGRVEADAPLATPGHWLRQCMEPIWFDAAIGHLLSTSAPSGILQLGGAGNLAQIAIGPDVQQADAPQWLVELSRRARVLVEPSQARDVGGAHALFSTLARVWEDGHQVSWQALLPPASANMPALPMQPMNLRPFRLAAQGPTPSVSPAGSRSGYKNADPRCESKNEAVAADSLLAALIAEFARTFGERGACADADFFQLGGHSLLALQLLYRVHERSGVRIPVRDLLLYPTPVALAARHSELSAKPSPPPQVSEDLPSQTVWQRVRAWSQEIASVANQRRMPLPDCLAADVADVIAQAKAVFNVRLYPHELLSLSTPEELAQLVVRACQESSLIGIGEGTAQVSQGLVRESERPVTDARTLTSVFILSSARSGSTLLRVMMAGHPNLFCPPELHLLMFADLTERKEKLGSSHFANGLVRAFQELLGVSWEEAGRVTAGLERDGLTVAEAYHRLTALCGSRLLVDKSPSYAEKYSHLERIDKIFDNSYAIHLVRHPLAVIESYVRNRIGSMNSRYGSAPPHVLAEEHWLNANLNIRRWRVNGRKPHFFLRYEDLVARPEAEMRAVSRALGLSFDAAMLTPYEGRRMLDGVGDPGIHEHVGIEAESAVRWQSRIGGLKLAPETRALAEEFGYVA